MKKLFLCTLACVGLFSCVSDKGGDVKTESEVTKEEMQANVENLLSTQVVNIEVPDGQIAIVRDEDSTVIATLTKTSNIIVPKGVATKAKSKYNGAPIEVEYLSQSNQGWNSAQGWNETAAGMLRYAYGENTNVLLQTVAFEDNFYGGSDYDYNDLVFNASVLIPTQGGEMKVAINPLALGSSFTFQLGFRYNGQEYIITPNDCRTDLFKGDAGCINTFKQNALKKYDLVEKTFTVTAMEATSSVDWFIRVNGKTLYAVNKFNNEWIDEKFMPYGFALSFAMNGGSNTDLDIFKTSTDKHLYGVYVKVGRNDEGKIINVSAGSGKVNANMNSWWNWPTENTEVNTVYPGFKSLVQNGSGTIEKVFKTQNGYLNNTPNNGVKANVIDAIKGYYKDFAVTGTGVGNYILIDDVKNGLYYKDELSAFFFKPTADVTNTTRYHTYNGVIWRGEQAYTVKDDAGYVILEYAPVYGTTADVAAVRAEIKAKYVTGQK